MKDKTLISTKLMFNRQQTTQTDFARLSIIRAGPPPPKRSKWWHHGKPPDRDKLLTTLTIEKKQKSNLMTKENIMKTLTQAPPFPSRWKLSALLIVLTMAIMLPTQALAGTAGGTSISNTARVDYTDSLNAPQFVESTVTITVNTVPAAPGVVYLEPNGATIGLNDTYTYNAAIFTKSNGSGTIDTITATDGNNSDIDLSLTPAADTFAASYTLGATSVNPGDGDIGTTPTIADGGTITFDVPSDGGPGDNVINDLAVNDKAYLWDGTNAYGPFDVTAVDDGAYTITLTNNTGADIVIGTAIAAGWQIGEAVVATVTVTQGDNITGSPATWDTVLAAEMNALSDSDTITTSAVASDIQVSKYIRNITDGTKNTGAADINFFGTDYYSDAGDVTANPGETLGYLIVVANSGTADATVTVLTDSVPAFTVIDTTTFGVDNDNDGAVDITDVDEDLEAQGDGIVYINGNLIAVYLGTGANDTAPSGTGGTVTGGTTINVLFEVDLQ